MTRDRAIPVAKPALAGNEKAYVLDCLESTWISSVGKYIDRFESAFAEFCSARHAISCSNGTVALHLALLALGIGPGDEVIVPTLTFVATANAVTYCGATPVFVDSEPVTWNISPHQLEAKVTDRTRAIIVVHLYGHPADMDPILELARRRGIAVIEDAAEAHGALYKGRPVGSLGDLGTFSFYGNKIITTGEGGMVVTNSDVFAARLRLLRGQGMDPTRRYWFPIIGYNYRMTNIAAAIGLAQLEKVSWHISRRREVAELYREKLAGVDGIVLHSEQNWAFHVYWMTSLVLDPCCLINQSTLMQRLADAGVETRPFFYPMHRLPMYRELAAGETFPVAEQLAAHGINLPSFSGLTGAEIDYVCNTIKNILSSA